MAPAAGSDEVLRNLVIFVVLVFLVPVLLVREENFVSAVTRASVAISFYPVAWLFHSCLPEGLVDSSRRGFELDSKYKVRKIVANDERYDIAQADFF